MPGRNLNTFWECFVRAIERHENSIMAAFADYASGPPKEYVIQLKKAIKANRLVLEKEKDVEKAPWRSKAVRTQLLARNPIKDCAFGKPFVGGQPFGWEPFD